MAQPTEPRSPPPPTLTHPPVPCCVQPTCPQPQRRRLLGLTGACAVHYVGLHGIRPPPCGIPLHRVIPCRCECGKERGPLEGGDGVRPGDHLGLPPPPPKTRSDPQRVRMSSGERPTGAAKGKQPDTEALCQPPPPPPKRVRVLVNRRETTHDLGRVRQRRDGDDARDKIRIHPPTVHRGMECSSHESLMIHPPLAQPRNYCGLPQINRDQPRHYRDEPQINRDEPQINRDQPRYYRGLPRDACTGIAEFLMTPKGVLPEPCAPCAVLLGIVCSPDPQFLNQSCPGLSLGCLCTTTAPLGRGCQPLLLALVQKVGAASLFGTPWEVKRSCTSMPPEATACRDWDPGCRSVGAVQRGNSSANIPKKLDRARTARQHPPPPAPRIRIHPVWSVVPQMFLSGPHRFSESLLCTHIHNSCGLLHSELVYVMWFVCMGRRTD